MTLVDDQGRVFGRWNALDALIGIVLLGLIPLLYGGYVLFKPSQPSLTSIEPARIASGRDTDFTVRGTNLRPYMRVSFGPHQGTRFLFADETQAVVPVAALPPGVYDVILYDHAQERARIANGLEVVASPRVEAQLEIIGSFTAVSDQVAQSLKAGEMVAGVGEIVRVGSRVPSATRATLGTTLLLDLPSAGLFNVPAVVRATCALVPRGGTTWCQIGDIPVLEDNVLRATLPGTTVLFQIDQLRLPGKEERITARVRFSGDRAALDLMRAGHRDVRRRNEFAAGGSIVSLTDARSASASVGVVIPAAPNSMPPFVATDVAVRDAVLELPVQRFGDEWNYAGRSLRAGVVTSFYGPNYELRGTVLSVDGTVTPK